MGYIEIIHKELAQLRGYNRDVIFEVFLLELTHQLI